jgi:hypothetical protein
MTVDGARAAQLAVLVMLGEPKPADLTPEEVESWQRLVAQAAEARSRGLIVEIPD